MAGATLEPLGSFVTRCRFREEASLYNRLYLAIKLLVSQRCANRWVDFHVDKVGGWGRIEDMAAFRGRLLEFKERPIQRLSLAKATLLWTRDEWIHEFLDNEANRDRS